MNDALMELIAYYCDQGAPGDQQMLMMLLREAQELDGGALREETLDCIARTYQMKETMLHALIRRVPSLRTADAPHQLDMCQTCKKGAELRAYVEARYGIKSGGVSAEGGFGYRVTPCMKNCKNGPSVRWDGELVPGMDLQKLKKLLETGKAQP